ILIMFLEFEHVREFILHIIYMRLTGEFKTKKEIDYLYNEIMNSVYVSDDIKERFIYSFARKMYTDKNGTLNFNYNNPGKLLMYQKSESSGDNIIVVNSMRNYRWETQYSTDIQCAMDIGMTLSKNTIHL